MGNIKHIQGGNGLNNLVIPVIGPTGVGKSTFINTILEEEYRRLEATRKPSLLKVGKSLRSCTTDIEAREIHAPSDQHHLKGRSVAMVDTPGFDGNSKNDVVILQKIANWLKKSYGNQTLAGVIYLHDISNDRFTGSARRNLETFKHMCGDNAFHKVVIVTTKAEKIPSEIADQYECEMRSEHWKDLVEAGVTVRRFNQDYQSARSPVDHLLHDDGAQPLILQLQKDVAVDKKVLPMTEAGKYAKSAQKPVSSLFQRFQGFFSRIF